MNTLVEKALQVALKAHEGQTNKTDDTPYIVHPVMVALLLARHGYEDHVLAAALLHDVLEDTDVSAKELKDEFGEKVLALVESLSENKSLPWEDRKRLYFESIRAAGPEVKAISLADKVHNMQRLLLAYKKHGSAMWQFFNRDKAKKLEIEDRMLAMFKETFPHPLVGEYERLLQEVKKLEG